MAAMINTTMMHWAVSATVILLVVLVLRRLFGERISRRMRYALWLVVLVRLLMPFSLGSSAFSIQNWLPVQAEVMQAENTGIPGDGTFVGEEGVSGEGQDGNTDGVFGPLVSENGQNIWQERPEYGQGTMQQGMEQDDPSGVPQGDDRWEGSLQDPGPVLSGDLYGDPERSGVATLLSMILPTLLQAWRIGAAVGILWILMVNGKFARHLKQTRYQVGQYQGVAVYTATELVSPCLFGVLRPAIYLTKQVAEQDEVRFYAILHEACHRRHGDHVWGLLRGACLAIWWWHPLVWMAAGLSRQDCELACDEACVARLGEAHRQKYGIALVRSLQDFSGAEKRSYIGAAATLFSGKEELKARLQALTKRPLVRYSAIAMVVVTIGIGVLVGFTGQSGTEITWFGVWNGQGGTENGFEAETTEEETTEADTAEEVTLPKETVSDLVGDNAQSGSLISEEEKILNGTVELETYTFPWSNRYTAQLTQSGVEVRKEIKADFAQNCLYYINKIHYDHHGIDYQKVDESAFYETIQEMQEKKFRICLKLVYEQDKIVEVYLKSNQQVISNMDNKYLWDPDRSSAYDNFGLNAYTVEREYQANISGASGMETIQIAANVINDGYGAVMVVRDELGELLYAEDISTSRNTREDIFLVEQDGLQMLLIWTFEDYDYLQSYHYRVFRLDQDGAPIPVAAASYDYRFALNEPEHTYTTSQLQVLVQPVYYDYMEQAVFLAGFDREVSETLYYESSGEKTYHFETLQAQAEEDQEAYWDAHPEARYENPDFEEAAQVLEINQEEGKVLLRMGTKEYEAVVHETCRFYVRPVVDQYAYEEVTLTEFLTQVQEIGNTRVHLTYEGGRIVEMHINSIREGLTFANYLWEDADGCLYGDSMDAENTYDWSQYELKAEYTADLSDQEGMETVKLYAGVMQIQPTEPVVVLVVQDAEGRQIYLEELDSFGHMRIGYYLGEQDGKAYLVRLYEEDRYNGGYFEYMAIRPDSETQLLSGCGHDWNLEWPPTGDTSWQDAFLEWGRLADTWLNGSQGILRIESGDSAEEFEYAWEYDLDWQAYAEEIQGRD